MNIEFISLNLNEKPNLLKLESSMNFRGKTAVLNSPSDMFIRRKTSILENPEKIELKKQINCGRDAKVYKTNFNRYVIRLKHGKAFEPEKLKLLEDPNGLIIAADDNDNMRLMKFVQGRPLYGSDWKIDKPVSKQKYMKAFNKITKLPDESFSQYIKDVLKIRGNGYDIDIFNPNNYLLNGNHIGIVDLKKGYSNTPGIDVWDFDPLVNRCHLLPVLNTMDKNEKIEFADKIKKFYDRIIQLAKKEGQNITKPVLYTDVMYDKNVIAYLYYKELDLLDEMIDFWLK